MKAPETDPVFEPFFSKQWSDLLNVSLYNFLSSVFQNMRIHTCCVILIFSIVSLNNFSFTNFAEFQYGAIRTQKFRM